LRLPRKKKESTEKQRLQKEEFGKFSWEVLDLEASERQRWVI